MAKPRNETLTERSETLIFVDIDGVINVGVGDPGAAAVNFDNQSIALAFKLAQSRPECADPIATRILATYGRALSGEGGATYAGLVSDNDTQFSDLLAGRLARIVKAAGKNTKVVLSSCWRMPKSAKKVRVLEQAASKHLGREFAFDDRTSLVKESGHPEDRLRFIGDYLEHHPWAGAAPKVLVLDDFCTCPINAWSLDGCAVNSAADAERYLSARAAPASRGVSVKVIHTYEEWTTPGGVSMFIGTGLTKKHVGQAYVFLATDAAHEPPRKANWTRCKSLAGATTATDAGAACHLAATACRTVIAPRNPAQLAPPPGLRQPTMMARCLRAATTQYAPPARLLVR